MYIEKMAKLSKLNLKALSFLLHKDTDVSRHSNILALLELSGVSLSGKLHKWSL